MQARLAARLEEAFGLTLSARKTEVRRTGSGVDFLGYRLFSHHRLPPRRNMAKARGRLQRQARAYAAGQIDAADLRRSLAGWLGHARFADTYNFRRRLLGAVRLRRGAGAPATSVPGARGGMTGPPMPTITTGDPAASRARRSPADRG